MVLQSCCNTCTLGTGVLCYIMIMPFMRQSGPQPMLVLIGPFQLNNVALYLSYSEFMTIS